MVVLPGDYLAAIEEYIPSTGTFSSDDSLYSSGIGTLELDAKSHSARVLLKPRSPRLQGLGSVVIGRVAETSESVAIIDLIQMESKGVSFIPNGVSAILHVSSIKRGYVKDLREEINIGDIVRVKIIDVSPHSTKLTTDSRELGVIKAFCSNCRQPLRMSGAKLICDRCGSVENRKTADDYGSGNLG